PTDAWGPREGGVKPHLPRSFTAGQQASQDSTEAASFFISRVASRTPPTTERGRMDDRGRLSRPGWDGPHGPRRPPIKPAPRTAANPSTASNARSLVHLRINLHLATNRSIPLLLASERSRANPSAAAVPEGFPRHD
uniref:Uncharacterized protein n=1 Tax=Aegilops tauschii subsp. strangulata TaxID=200361 RepID=A0A453QJP7_AEGTS